MKKKTWANLFGTALASATVGTVYLVSKKMTKKYGQSPKTQKLFDVSINNIINAAVDTFLNTDDERIGQITDFFE